MSDPARTAIDMAPIKEKLRNLQEYMPNQEEQLYDFAKLLADVLNPTLYPCGFHLAANFVLYDLETGKDQINGSKSPDYARIFNHLSGYPPLVFTFMRMMLPDIAKAVAPKEFADEVQKEQDKLMAFLKSKSVVQEKTEATQ